MHPFDLPGMLRRIRRLADVSQRELARACGVSQAAVAQAETGRRELAVGTLAAAAALAGLRLTLLDGTGTEVVPMSPDTVRDRGNHRFPAHLDTRRADEGRWLYEPRRDRPEPSFTVTRDRANRDAGRHRRGTPDDHHPERPGDSPADRAAARRQERRRADAAERERRFLAGEFAGIDLRFECTCPAACDELDDRSGRPVHAPECSCDCDLA
jgi:transcriptional regulator with XRE-family HTH domain